MPTFDPGRFAVREIELIGNGLWRAGVECAMLENLSGAEVAQVCRITVRFSYASDGSADGLLEAAKDKAQESLSDAAVYLRQHSAADLIETAFEANREMTPEELTAEIARRMDEQT